MSNNGLKKELGFSQIVAMAAGGMIGGWMVEIKLWFDLSGPGSAISLITCAILVLSLCFIYGEMTAMLPYAGGENVWISNSVNWDIGWFSFWFVMLLYVMGVPTVTYGIATMLSYLYPITFVQTKIVAAIILIIWYILSNFEIKILAKLQNLLFWIMLVCSIFASITFLTSHNWSLDTLLPLFPKGVEGYSAAVGLLIMKFIGFDLIPQLSEEANMPRNKLILAFIASLGVTLLVYVLAVIGIGGIVSSEWVTQVDVVDPRVADLIGKHWLALIIVIAGLGACITTLSGFYLAASRTLFGAARQYQVPQWFGKLNKHGQPSNANILVFFACAYFTIFAPETWLNYIYAIYGIAAGVVYFLVVVSFVRLRKLHPEWERPFKVKNDKFVAVVATFFCIWVLVSAVLAMDKGSWITLVGYFIAGLLLWLLVKSKQKSDPENWPIEIVNPDNTPID